MGPEKSIFVHISRATEQVHVFLLFGLSSEESARGWGGRGGSTPTPGDEYVTNKTPCLYGH